MEVPIPYFLAEYTGTKPEGISDSQETRQEATSVVGKGGGELKRCGPDAEAAPGPS